MASCKVFISQPMRNREEPEILQERQWILEEMPRIAEILGGMVDGFPDPEDEFREVPIDTRKTAQADPLRALGRSIDAMSRADVVVFAPEWYYARGCRIEHRCCEDYGVKLVVELQVKDTRPDGRPVYEYMLRDFGSEWSGD